MPSAAGHVSACRYRTILVKQRAHNGTFFEQKRKKIRINVPYVDASLQQKACYGSDFVTYQSAFHNNAT